MIRVIAIDDDYDMLEVFSEYLSIKGLEVVGVGHNGKEAARLYQKHKPDIVFCDVMMPEYDGFYALEKIHAFDPHARVVMVTADLTEDTERRLIELNASGIIYKPYEIDEIIVTVEKVLNGKPRLINTQYLETEP